MIKKLPVSINSLIPKPNQNTARMLTTKSFGTTAKWLCFVLFFMVSFANAATRTASVTGDWNSTVTWGGLSVPNASDDVFINSGVTVTIGTSAATCLNLNILSGGFLTVGGFNLTVAGDTNISGTLTHNNISGSKIFTGNVTINTGGVWNETVAAIINFGGNLTNNNNFTSSTGIHTFTGTGKTISGNNTVDIPNITINGTTTNNGILTVSNALAGTGTLTNADTATLNLGGTSTITNLVASANGNTVNYNGSPQNVKAITYNDLILSGSGIKTFPSTALIINNLLAISSGVTANLNGNTSHIAGILQFGSVNQLIGNYGGAGSSAAIISAFFTSNNGRITVSGSPIDNDYASYGTTGDVGGTIPETGGGFTLTAPTGSVLINVKFASYGLPTGTYPSYGLGSCHATTSKDNTIALLGNNSWSFNATGGVLNAMYGDPCVGTVKRYNVVATYAQPICTSSTPGTILINGSTPTRGTGAYTYTWEKSITSATAGYSIISGASSKDYTVPAGIAQTTWYRRNVSSGSYTSNTIVIVQVNKAPSLTLPTAAAISGTTSICAGNSTTLTVSGGSLSGETVASGDKGGYIQWYSGACAGSGVYIAEGNSITVSPTATTTYYVRYKNSCGETSCISTTVTTSVSITAANTATPVCRSTTSQVANLVYTATTGTPNNYSIVWSSTPSNSFANIPITTALPSGSIPITVPANTAPGTYTGKLTVRNSTTGCVSFENTFTVTVNALPTAPTATVTTQPNCTVSTGTITVSSPVAGTSYSIDGSVYTNTTGIFTGVAPGPYNVTAKSTSGCFSAATPVTVNAPALKTWTGASGTNWNTAGNWNPSVVPTSADCVVIPNVTNKPIISGTNGTFFANIITINNGGILTVDPTNTLTVTGAVTVNTGGTLNFENNSSLIQDVAATVNINSGNITYKRASAAMKNFDYSYWSSPVEAQTLFNLSPNTLSDKYFSYTGIAWQQEVASSVTMSPGIGYIIRTPKAGLWLNGENVIFPYAQPVQFIGKPNNGTISGQAVTIGNFYLIGNPYPSALDADEFLFKTTLNGNVNSNNDILNGTIYFWTHNTAIQQSGSKYIYKSDDYASYNGTGGAATSPGNNAPPSGNIAAGQSFFASAKGSGTIQFKNNMRVVGDNGQFFKPGKTSKTTKTEKNRLWLNMTNEGGAFKQALIGYVTGATNDYEGDFDGVSFDGNSFIDFYSVNNTNKLVIQGRALPFEENDNVPLGFRSVIAGNFTIAIDKADGLLTNQKVYLEDKDTKAVHDLTEKEYTFATPAGTFNDRFVVKYTNKTLGTGDFETVNDGVNVIIKNKFIAISSQKENINKVFVYDISGKQLYQKDKISNVVLAIENLKSAEQVLLVKVVLENGFQTTKKVIFK